MNSLGAKILFADEEQETEDEVIDLSDLFNEDENEDALLSLSVKDKVKDLASQLDDKMVAKIKDLVQTDFFDNIKDELVQQITDEIQNRTIELAKEKVSE